MSACKEHQKKLTETNECPTCEKEKSAEESQQEFSAEMIVETSSTEISEFQIFKRLCTWITQDMIDSTEQLELLQLDVLRPPRW